MQPAHIRIAQLSIAALSFVFGIAIMGTAGHALEVYNSSARTNPWWLPLWNSHFDIRGTNSLIGAGAMATVTNLIFIVLCFVPKLNFTERVTTRAFTAFALAVPTAMVTLGIFMFAIIIDKNSPETETILTWTCKFKGSTPLSTSSGVPSGVSNSDFGRLCTESKFALYTTLVVFLLQGLMLVVAVFGWCAEKWLGRKEKKNSKFQELEMNEHKQEPHMSVHSITPPPRY